MKDKTKWTVFFTICAVMAIAYGCSTTHTSTTTPNADGSTTVTETTAYNLNMDQVNGVVTTVGSVIDLIGAAQAQNTPEPEDNSLWESAIGELGQAAVDYIAGLIRGSGTKALVSEDIVQARATAVTLDVLSKTGRLPCAVDVAAYVVTGKEPKATALKSLKKTGRMPLN